MQSLTAYITPDFGRTCTADNTAPINNFSLLIYLFMQSKIKGNKINCSLSKIFAWKSTIQHVNKSV